MPENYEEFNSLTLRTRNLRRPLRMLVRNWKHQLLLLCLAKLWRRIVGSGASNKIKNKTCVHFWKLVNLQDCVWEYHYRIIMKTILQEKEIIHYSIKIFGSQIYSYASSHKNSSSKGSSGQGTGKIGKIFGVEPERSQKWERSDRWSKNEGRKSSFCIFIIWKMLNWRQSTKNTKVELYSEVIL